MFGWLEGVILHNFVSTAGAEKAFENRALLPSVCLTIFTTIYTDGYNWIIPSDTGGHLPTFGRIQHPAYNWYGSSLFPQLVICMATCNPHAEKGGRQIVLLRHIPICYQPRRPSSQQPRLPLFSVSSHFAPSAHICLDVQPHPHPRG